jgi:hypothetical protein
VEGSRRPCRGAAGDDDVTGEHGRRIGPSLGFPYPGPV